MRNTSKWKLLIHKAMPLKTRGKTIFPFWKVFIKGEKRDIKGGTKKLSL